MSAVGVFDTEACCDRLSYLQRAVWVDGQWAGSAGPPGFAFCVYNRDSMARLAYDPKAWKAARDAANAEVGAGNSSWDPK